MPSIFRVRTTLDRIGPPEARMRALCALALVGYGLRIALWGVSEGSNDIRTWRMFAQTIRAIGLADTYRTQAIFNHPPLMGWWSVAALDLADHHVLTFAQAFKIPSLLAEVATGLLLVAAWKRRGEALRAWQAFAAYGLALSCILISAFHGNTDALYVCLVLASAYSLEAGRPLTAGAALAAAVNVKLIPVLLIAPLASRCARWADLRRFLAGVVLGAGPFLIALATFTPDQRSHFVHNLFAYRSSRENWGVELAVRVGAGITQHMSTTFAAAIRRVGDWYWMHGAAVLLVAVCGLAAWHAWRVRRQHDRALDAYQLAALTFALFLLFGSGFGVQYVGCVVAPLVAWSVWDGVLVASVTGFFIGTLYTRFMVGWWPMVSMHRPAPLMTVGLSILAWITLATVAWRVARCARLPPVSRHELFRQPRRALAWAGWAVAVALIPFVASRLPGLVTGSTRFEIAAPADTSYVGALALAVSPNGRQLVFETSGGGGAASRLWLRALNDVIPTPIEGPSDISGVFWSPDGRWLGLSSRSGEIRKVSVTGSRPVTISSGAAGDAGGAWGPDGTILFGRPDGRIWRIPASGGTAQPVTEAVPGEWHRFPSFLPDGQEFVYLALPKSELRLGSIESFASRPLFPADSAAVYMVPGFLVFVTLGDLVAQPVDEAFRPVGEPALLAHQVMSSRSGAAGFAVSQSVLAYRRGWGPMSALNIEHGAAPRSPQEPIAVVVNWQRELGR